MQNITFEKLDEHHEFLVYKWLAEPHMIEFWDNSQEHKEDIAVFCRGRKVPSSYFNGIFDYWIGLIDNTPYSLIMTSEMKQTDQDLSELHKVLLSKTGKTIGLDFGIGNTDFLGRGFAPRTLIEFMDFYRKKIDQKVDTFIIDPDENNPRAQYVYEKAGFEYVGKFYVDKGYYLGKASHLMIKVF